MEKRGVFSVILAAAGVVACAAGAAAGGRVQAWGLDADGQVTFAPAGDNYVAIAAGDAHGLALRSDGMIVAWGQDDDGQQ